MRTPPRWIGAPSDKPTGNTVAICQAAKAADKRRRIDWAFQPPESAQRAEECRLRRKVAMREGVIEARTERLLARFEQLAAAFAEHEAQHAPASPAQLQSLAAQFNR